MPKDDKVHLWIGSKLKAKSQRLAQKRDQSLSALIRYLLRRETEEE
jgi:hypothetical protein